MVPNFSVIIGSAGRDTLRVVLESFERQELVEGDQIIVCHDAYDPPVPEIKLRMLLHEFDSHSFHSSRPGRYIYTSYSSGYHWYGVEQLNHILRTVPLTGSHVITLGDDDILVDNAFKILRPICARDLAVPVLYRFVAPWREILWEVPRMQISRISGCCIAAPRNNVGLFPTKLYVEHDFDWMLDILNSSKRDPVWLDEVLVIARPDPFGNDVKHRGVIRRVDGWAFIEDMKAQGVL